VRDKGLSCAYIISRYPAGASVTDRAVPVVVFSAEPATRKGIATLCSLSLSLSLSLSHIAHSIERLKNWLGTPSLNDYSVRNILDWDYYRGRLSGVVQKLITIPAFYQVNTIL
jgi:DNA polymerase epsilon subunit 1